MFLMFLSMISRYIAAFCDLKKRTRIYFIILRVLSFYCPQLAIVLDLKTGDCFKERLRIKELWQ